MARSRFAVDSWSSSVFSNYLLTNILGPVVPDIIGQFHERDAAGIPGFRVFHRLRSAVDSRRGFLVKRFRKKPVMVLAFLAGAVGSLSSGVFPVTAWRLFPTSR